MFVVCVTQINQSKKKEENMTALSNFHQNHRWSVDYVANQATELCTRNGAALYFVFDDPSNLTLTFWNNNDRFLGERYPRYAYRCENCPQSTNLPSIFSRLSGGGASGNAAAAVSGGDDTQVPIYKLPPDIQQWGQHGLQKANSRTEFTSVHKLFEYLASNPSSRFALQLLFEKLINATQFRSVYIKCNEASLVYNWDQINRKGSMRSSCRYTHIPV